MKKWSIFLFLALLATAHGCASIICQNARYVADSWREGLDG